jgi:sugar (pentulose or hexulose) kinase
MFQLAARSLSAIPTHSPLWRPVKVPLRFPAEAEAAALGAALQAAAVGSGIPVREFVATHPPPLLELVVSPDPSTVGAYQAAYERHVRLGAALFAQPKS